MDFESFRDLVAGCSETHLAAFLKVNLKTFRRWKSGASKPPHSAVIALQFHLSGDLATIGGDEWRGFSLRGGKLHAPFFKRPFDPFQIQAMFFDVQMSRHYKREAERLASEVERLRAEAWAAAKVQEAIRPSRHSVSGIGRS